jgi:hypothetical protein
MVLKSSEKRSRGDRSPRNVKKQIGGFADRVRNPNDTVKAPETPTTTPQPDPRKPQPQG